MKVFRNLPLRVIAGARRAGVPEAVLQAEDERLAVLGSGGIPDAAPSPAAKKTTTKKHVERVEDVETVEDDGDSDPDDSDRDPEDPCDDEEAAAADRERAYAASFSPAARRGGNIPCTFRRA